MRHAHDDLSRAFATMTDQAWAGLADAQQQVQDVLALAVAWQAGRLPLSAVRSYCTGAERAVVMRALRPSPSNPAPAAFLALLDALIASNAEAAGGAAHATTFGVFTEAELRTAGVKQDRMPDGQIRYRFPQREPWLQYPNPEAASPEERLGTRDAPYYPPDPEERRRVSQVYADTLMGDGPKKQPKQTKKGAD